VDVCLVAESKGLDTVQITHTKDGENEGRGVKMVDQEWSEVTDRAAKGTWTKLEWTASKCMLSMYMMLDLSMYLVSRYLC
jgi:hypothetical protein